MGRAGGWQFKASGNTFAGPKGAVKDEDVKWLYNLRDARDAQVRKQAEKKSFGNVKVFGLSRS